MISMTELRYTLDALNAERELRRFEDRGMKLRQFEALPNLVEGYLRDLPNLLDHAPPVRDYETVPEERTPENPLGFYSLTPGSIRHLTKGELAEKKRAAEDARGKRFRAVYDDLGVWVVAHPHGTPEVGYKFEGNAKLFRTEHSLVQSFEPGEDWIFCYVDKVVVERR